VDDHGSSWDECRHKVCGRNTYKPPIKLCSFTFFLSFISQ
jgi:hypothetical protein